MTRQEFLNKIWENEDQMTADCFQYSHNNYPFLRGLFFHVPNGGLRNIREATKLKGMGVIPGEPDFVNLYNKVCGLELKMEKVRNTKNGGLSDDQIKIHIKWRAAGREVYVIYNAIEFLDVLENKILKTT